MKYHSTRHLMALTCATLLVGSIAATAHAVCGDSEPNAGEACDDGNTAPGDGCSSTCSIEPGFECTAAMIVVSNENMLLDGSFEGGNAGGEWISLNHSIFGTSLCGDFCFGVPFAAGPDGGLISGNYVLLAGGSFSGPSTGNATHAAVQIPVDATTLEFQWAALGSSAGDPCAGPTDGLALEIGGTQVWSNLDTGPCTRVIHYERVSIDLATAAGGPYQGNMVGFEFLGSATGMQFPPALTNVILDDVSLNIPGPPTPTPSICTSGQTVNGSFESELQPSPTRVDIANVTDWMATGGFSLLERGVNNVSMISAQDGVQFISMGHNGATGTVLEQEFPISPGVEYEVRFWVRAIQGAAPDQYLEVRVFNTNGVLLNSSVAEVDNFDAWLEHTLVFTASTASAVIELEDTGDSLGTNIALDNVSVTLPEPGALSMLVSGGLAILGLRWSRRRCGG